MAGHVAVLFVFVNLIALCASEEGRHTRFEYKQSFKGPHLVNKQAKVPFWDHYGSAIPSDEQVRITPSLKDQKGGLWARTKTTNEFWEVEVFFKISGRGRVGGDGLAVWFTEEAGKPGPVFGSSDKWNGMGLFFDSFDNDGEQNNPYVMVMLNDKSLSYDHHKDGNNQQLGGCLRDFRNRPNAVRAKIRYYNNILTVFYHGGMTNKDEDYELCMRAENVHLPKQGFFGVTAATGGLADDHDVLKFLTHSLTPPLTDEQKAKQISEDERKKYEEQYGEYAKKLETQKEEYQKENPEKFKKPEEKFESVYERDVRMMYEAANAIHQLIMALHTKTGELTKEINNLHGAVSTQQASSGGEAASRQEMNTLISLQNNIHNMLKDQTNLIQGSNNAHRIEKLESTLHTVMESMNNLPGLISAQQKAPECPEVNCVTTGTLLFFLIAQVMLFFGYQFYKNHQEQAAKKFY